MRGNRKGIRVIRKRVLSYAIAGFMVLSLAACGGNDESLQEAAVSNRAESAAEGDTDAAPSAAEESKTQAPQDKPKEGSEAQAPQDKPEEGSEAQAPQDKPGEGSEAQVPQDKPKEEPEVRNMHDELEEELENKITEQYERRLLLHEAVRTIVAEEIRNTGFVTIEPKEQFSVTEVLIDEATGNPIASEGVKEFLRAAAEGKSVQDMCHAALEAGISEIPDYLAGTMESSLQDAVTSLIGIDVFTPVSVISQWMNPDQEPTALLQGIVEEQQNDVGALMLFMQQEEISAADIYKVAQMVYGVEKREQEIIAAQGGIREYVNHPSMLRELAEQYADAEAQLAFYGEILLPDTVPEYDEDERKNINGLQSEAGKALEQYEPLYSLTVGNVSANYDIEGFREAQKYASQAGLLGGTLFGDLVGGLMTESKQVFNGQVQENRRTLCDMLTAFMEESYVETAAAQAAFVKQYSILLHMSQAEGRELYLADIYLNGHEWQTELEEAKMAYVTALARYVGDLDSANILYNCILTSQQVNYLFDLQIEIDSIHQVLRAVEPVWYEYGYSNEEVLERWSKLASCYVDSVNFLVERRATMGEAPGFYTNGGGKYDGTEYHVYTKEFTAESRPVLITGGGRSYYYDMNGYLICMDAEDARVTGRSMHVLSYQSRKEGAEIKTSWADWGSPEIQSMEEQSLKAQELYAHFWGAN